MCVEKNTLLMVCAQTEDDIMWKYEKRHQTGKMWGILGVKAAIEAVHI